MVLKAHRVSKDLLDRPVLMETMVQSDLKAQLVLLGLSVHRVLQVPMVQVVDPVQA